MTKDHNIQIIMADHKYRFTSGHRLRAALFQNSFTLIMVGGLISFNGGLISFNGGLISFNGGS